MRFSSLIAALLYCVFSFNIDLAASFENPDDHDGPDPDDDLDLQTPLSTTYNTNYYAQTHQPYSYHQPSYPLSPYHPPPYYGLPHPGPFSHYGDGAFPYLAVDAMANGARPGSFGSALLGGQSGANFAPFVMATGGQFGLGGGMPGVLPYGHTDIRYWDVYRAKALLGGNPGYQAGKINPFDKAPGSYNQWWLDQVEGGQLDPMVYQKFTAQNNPLGPMLGNALYGDKTSKRKRRRRSVYHPARLHRPYGHRPYNRYGPRSFLDSTLGLLALTNQGNGDSNIDNNLAVLLAAQGGFGGHYGGHHHGLDPFAMLALSGSLGDDDDSGGIFGKNNLAPFLLASGALRRPGIGGRYSAVPYLYGH